MKKILSVIFIILFVLGIFALVLGQWGKVAAETDQETHPTAYSEEQPEDIASEFEKAAGTAGQQIEKFASQFEKIMDTIQRTIKNIGPQIKKMRDIIQQKTKEMQSEISEEFSTPSGSDE